MKVISVLIVSGGGFQGHALIKALRERPDVRVVMTDCYAENVSRYFADRFVQAPLLDEPDRFLAFALDLCQRESISAVFAATDFELDLLSRNRELFQASGATVFVSDAPLLAIARDKKLFHEWLQAEELPTLPCFDTPTDKTASLPLFGKPRHGWGGCGTCVVRSLDAIRALGTDALRTLIWQPLLEGFKEYSVDFSVDPAGRISPLGLRHRVRTVGGFAILGAGAEDPRILPLAERVIGRMLPLGARGPMNLQLLATPDGCWISDLNPRVGTSMPLSLAAGSNPVTFLLGGDGTSTCRGAFPQRYRCLRALEEMCIPDLHLGSVRGVVFDLDDTLIDQKKWIMQKLHMTWQRERSILPDERSFLAVALRVLEEGNRSRMFDAVSAELGLDEPILRRLIATYRESVPERCDVYGDVVPCLDQLRRLGYKLGLITDNPPLSQQQKLDRSGLRDCFDALVLTEEIGAQKPDLRGFAAISDRLGLPSTQLVMVGDNLFRDVQASINAGFAHAFHVQRKGAFFNFSTKLISDAIDLSNFTATTQLTEVLWHLTGTSSDE